MKILRRADNSGFTMGEMMISLSLSSILIATALGASVGLQKSFAAVDDFFATHLQQIRIIDYLSRDVKRAYAVTTSADKLTVNCTVPNYVIATGDADAGSGNINIGKRRAPTITPTANGAVIDYGTTTSTVTYSLSNQTITRIENGVITTIAASTDSLIPETTDVELSNTEYASSTVTFMPKFNFHPNNGNGNANGQDKAARDGTTVFAKAYLRNKRRG